MIIESLPDNFKRPKPKSQVGDDIEKIPSNFKDLIATDELSLKNIVNISSDKEQKRAINEYIGKILDDYKHGEKTKDEFEMMMKRLQLMSYVQLDISNVSNGKEENKISRYLYNKDRSWSQKQVDDILQLFEKSRSEKNSDDPDDVDYFGDNYFWTVFTTHSKNKKEQQTVSEHMARYLARRIENGGPLPEALQEEIRGWSQNIQMVDSGVRLDFISAILNNPGKVSSHTAHEAMAFMGLYGPELIKQLNDNLEANKDDIGKALKVISVLNFLSNKREQPGFGDSGGAALKSLDEAKNKTKNYFIKSKIDQVLKKPLDDYTFKEKRLFLQSDWRNIVSPHYFYDTIKPILGRIDHYSAPNIDPTDEDMLSDSEVDKIFNRYRIFAPEFYYWVDKGRLKRRYDNESLRHDYDITPIVAKQEYHKQEIISESCYSRLNNKYGAIYTPDGYVDSFFKLDPVCEENSEEERKMDGTIAEEHLEFFVDKFGKALKEKIFSECLYYLQIRYRLPDEIRSSLDNTLKITIPPELDRDFYSIIEFENELKSYAEELMNELKIGGAEKKLDILNKELRGLLGKRREAAGQKYLGYKSENTELLDFFNSFNTRSFTQVKPTAHHTICYYLYIRKDLPDDLVKEFEQKFDVHVPDKLKEFATFDDYMGTKDVELLAPFMNYPNYHEMASWLNQRIGGLSERIKELKIKPERLSLSEILKEEGFLRDAGSEENERLLLTYKSLIELPLRKKIENEFGVRLEDYSIREQVQFVNFLALKTSEGVDAVKKFLGEAGDEESRQRRVRSFLSLESGNLSGDEILKIGEELVDVPELADKLFSEYSRIVDGSAEDAYKLVEMYNDIFYGEKINKNKASNAILQKGYVLLKNTAAKLEGCQDDEKAKIINDLITSLRHQEGIQKKVIEQLFKLAGKLNRSYREIEFDDSFSSSVYDSLEEMDISVSNYYNGHEDKEEIIEKLEKIKKYDAFRIQGMINDLQSQIDHESPEKENFEYEEDFERYLSEEARKNIKELKKEYADDIKKNNSKKIKQLQDLLKLQKKIEQMLKEFVYSQDNPKEEDGEHDSHEKLLFKKYKKIIHETKKLSIEALNELFKKKPDIKESDIESIANLLITKANKLLNEYFDKAIKGIDPEIITKELEDYQENSVFTAGIYKALKNEGALIGIDDLIGVEFDKKKAGRLTGSPRVMDLITGRYEELKESGLGYDSKDNILDKFREESRIKDFSEEELENLSDILRMLEVYGRNYDNRPEFRNELIAGFIEQLVEGSEKTTIYSIKKDKEIMAFLRYDDKGDDRLYFGSFNVSPSLQDSAVGSALFAESIEKEAEGKKVEATCDAFTPASAMYIEKGGFVVYKINEFFSKKIEEKKEGGGVGNKGEYVPGFYIWRDKSIKYRYQEMETEMLKNEYERNQEKGNILNIGKDQIIIKLSSPADKEAPAEILDLINNKGMVMTRFAQIGNGEYLCAFEKRKGEIRDSDYYEMVERRQAA